MRGMNAHTGQALDGLDHLRQSVRDILTTPVGSRVMRRDYGSLLPALLDQPLNDALMLQLYAATVMALARWEPRLVITRVHRGVNGQQHGQATLGIDGQTETGPLSIAVPLYGALP